MTSRPDTWVMASRAASGTPGILTHYASHHIAPALLRSGCTSVVDLIVDRVLAQRRGERPVSIASVGSGRADVEVTVAARLVESGFRRFHLDYLDESESLLAGARALARERGLDPHFSFIHATPTDRSRSLGTYDAHLAVRNIGATGDEERVLTNVAATMTDTSVLLLAQAVGPEGQGPWNEAIAVLDQLFGELLVKHRFDHMRGHFVSSVRGATMPDRVTLDAIARTIDANFDPEEVFTFGGLVDTFLGTSFGPNFTLGSESDVRFIDAVCQLEKDLGARGALRPTRLVACLRRKGHARVAPEAVPSLKFPAPQVAVPATRAPFVFPREERLLHHVMNGRTDDGFLQSGFYYWEPETGVRWAGREPVLRLPLPREAAPYTCLLTLTCIEPVRDPGGATVLVNGVRTGRIESLESALASSPSREVQVSFVTLGGPTVVTLLLDHPQKEPDSHDVRELGLVIRAFTVSLARAS